jgi:hypothetical protein
MYQEYTNKFNLPPEIVACLTKDRYNPDGTIDLGDYSATTICAPIQQTILKRRYPDKWKVRDVIDNMWAFVGSIAHKVLEEHGTDDALIEERFYVHVRNKKISGQVDHYKSAVISDYKSTKAYKIIKGDYLDWEQQLNIYAFLAWANGHPVTLIRIFAFILDWKQAESYKKNYPACPIVEIPLRLWTNDEQLNFITEQVRLLQEAENTEDSKLPECSSRNMWQSVKDYAILKEGAKRAIKCYDTEEEAMRHPLKAGEFVKKRMTGRTRCKLYCPVSEICHQNKLLTLEENGGTIGEESTEEPIF